MPKPTYTPLQKRSLTPVHELTTDELQQLIHFVTEKWIDKKRLEGVIRVMRSKMK